ESSVNDLHTLVDVIAGRDRRTERKAVTELRPEVAFFRIHRADEGELSRMGDTHAIAFDPINPACGRVEEHVYQVVIKQIHLINVQNPTVRAGEESGIELVVAVERISH